MSLDIRELAKLSDRLLEDRLYEIVMEEAVTGNYDQSAQARAFEEALGDDAKAKALYIKHRVRRLRDLAVEQKLCDEIEKARAEDVLRQQKKVEDEQSEKIRTAFMSSFEKKMYKMGRKLRK